MQTRILGICAAVALCAGTLASAQQVTDAKTFAAAAASSNMFEIASSEIALQKATSDDVKQFAQHMIDDHTAAGVKMNAAAQKDGIAPPDAMLEKDQAQLQKLQSAAPDAFQAEYVAAQATAHDQAVALFKTFSESGQESALRAFAAETLPTLQEHQAEVHKLAQ